MNKKTCPECYGSGRISRIVPAHTIMGKGQFFHYTKTEYTTCPRCNGAGYLAIEENRDVVY